MATLAPFSANFSAIPRPMPRELPVTMACLPFSDDIPTSLFLFPDFTFCFCSEATRGRGWRPARLITTADGYSIDGHVTFSDRRARLLSETVGNDHNLCLRGADRCPAKGIAGPGIPE